MAKAKKFPKMLYVKRVVDGDLEYWNSAECPAGALDDDESARLGVYELVETVQAKSRVVVDFTP